MQVSDERVNHDTVTSHESEIGSGSISTVSSTVSSVESEKAAYEFLAQTPIKSTDAHLVEFSEAMRSKETKALHGTTKFLIIYSYIYLSVLSLAFKKQNIDKYSFFFKLKLLQKHCDELQKGKLLLKLRRKSGGVNMN